MLYLTTRSTMDAYTPFRTLGQGRGDDQGLFVPLQMPRLDTSYILALKTKSFGQNVADILNLLLNTRLDGMDVDFCIGKYPVKFVPMSNRTVVAETWHNPDYDFARAVRNLSGRIRGLEDTSGVPTDWMWVSTRIAYIFGLYGILSMQEKAGGCSPMDIAVPSGDFAAPMAAWYAREMGIPIENIICSCDDNDAAWELLHGQKLDFSGSMKIPADLERLVYAIGGREEVNKYTQALESKGVYCCPVDENGGTDGLFTAVISAERRASVINNVYRNSAYILDPGSAMAYGGLQDFRATDGKLNMTLIITERSPICSAQTVASAMEITVDVLKERLNLK